MGGEEHLSEDFEKRLEHLEKSLAALNSKQDEIDRATPVIQAAIRLRERLDPDLLDYARRLSDESEEAVDEVVLKALNLYRVALKAARDGNRLTVLSPEDDILTEITGIAPVGTASASH